MDRIKLLGFLLLFCNASQPSEAKNLFDELPGFSSNPCLEFFEKYDLSFLTYKKTVDGQMRTISVDINSGLKNESYRAYGNFMVREYKRHPQGLSAACFNIDTGIVRLYYDPSGMFVREISLPCLR